MQLKELLFGVSIDAVLGSTSVSIEGVTSDSRVLGTNSLFVAIRGEHHDGHVTAHVRRSRYSHATCELRILPASKSSELSLDGNLTLFWPTATTSGRGLHWCATNNAICHRETQNIMPERNTSFFSRNMKGREKRKAWP